MGCCVSTNNGASIKHRDFQSGSESLKLKSTLESRAPPPSAEEETVKEVLSETPKLKPPAIENSDHEKQIHIQPPFLDNETIKPNGYKKDSVFQEEEMISEQEVSEVCSLSMSETVSTTTFDDDGEVKQKMKRSPAAKLPARNPRVPRDRIVGKSPTKRTDQSPDKRNNAGRVGGGGSARMVQSKESGTYQGGRRGLAPSPNRKDPGEGSGRRSRSPATNRSAMGRNPSAKRTNGSPGRVRKDVPDIGSSSGGVEDKLPSTADATVNESLENPLVSLECFIFL